MANKAQQSVWTSAAGFRHAVVGLVLTVLFVLACSLQSTWAQTFSVIYNFTGGPDGANPFVGLTIDAAGHLYGAALEGGYQGNGCADLGGCGTVFKLSHKNSSWILTPLYNFMGGNDGTEPQGTVAVGSDGSIYGTTFAGGINGPCNHLGGDGCGTVFNLRPPARACTTALCPWAETVLYRFAGGSDGANPAGNIIFGAGNLYGTTTDGAAGGSCSNDFRLGCGTVYELIPSNGGWMETILYRFTGGTDGAEPQGGVIFDKAGNFYGTTEVGTIFQLASSGSGLQTIHTFQSSSDGGSPYAGLVSDPSGNLYGAATAAGPNGGGTVYEISPSGGGWNFALLYAFSGNLLDNEGPFSNLAIDSSGSLYGTTLQDGMYGQGNVFKLTPSGSGGWVYTDLYDFTGGRDGGWPYGGVTLDANGNLYGTAFLGGTGKCSDQGTCGVIWEITP